MTGEVIAPAWKLLGKKIAPGFYQYAGVTHVDARELCQSRGLECTKPNLERLLREVSEAARRQGIPFHEAVS